MPPAIRPKHEVIEILTAVFRRWGYDAATLSRLSEATGLGKASLYHYFPNGKRDMGKAVLDHLSDLFQTEIVVPFDKTHDARTAFESLVAHLFEFYFQGKTSCIMELFTLGTAKAFFGEEIKSRLGGLQAALAGKARQAGIPKEKAEQRALQALALIQGSLVVARVLDDPDAFSENLKELPTLMLAPVK